MKILEFKPDTEKEKSTSVKYLVDKLATDQETIEDICIIYRSKDGLVYTSWSDMKASDLLLFNKVLELEVTDTLMERV